MSLLVQLLHYYSRAILEDRQRLQERRKEKLTYADIQFNGFDYNLIEKGDPSDDSKDLVSAGQSYVSGSETPSP